MENCTYQQKQGTNVGGFYNMDSMFHFRNKNTYEEQRIEVTY
jgi:K+-transporting ATPase A subunit